MCLDTFSLCNQPSEKGGDLNVAAVNGIMSIGGGFYNLEEFLACLDVPAKAAKEEAEYAQQIGSIDDNGTPLVPVVADGCWSKRSYRNNYSALSGAAAIVGQHTGKVLYIDVRNKFCSYCSKANSERIKDHICSKSLW